MALNLDVAIQRQENAIRKKLVKGEPIPPAVIGHYNDLLGANLGGEINNIDSDAAVSGSLQNLFVPASTAVTDGVVLAEPGYLAAGLFTNLNTTDTRFLLLFDKATAPTGADTPIASYILNPSSAYELQYDFLPLGVPVANGIAWAFSTDPDMYVAASAANKLLTFFYYV